MKYICKQCGAELEADKLHQDHGRLVHYRWKTPTHRGPCGPVEEQDEGNDLKKEDA